MADFLFGNVYGARRDRRFKIAEQQPIVDEFTDEDLRHRYRFGSESIHFITDLFAPDLHRETRRNHALDPTTQVLIALQFYASGSFLQVVGDTVGLDIGCEAKLFYQMANNEWRAGRKQKCFLPQRWFPMCDRLCGRNSHQHPPSQHENDYVNRKGFHSINVQGICNHEGEWQICCHVIWHPHFTYEFCINNSTQSASI